MLVLGWMTAQVLLKLASKLFAAQNPLQFTSSPGTQNTKENTRLPYHHKKTLSTSSTDSSHNSNGGVSLLDTDIEEFNRSILGKTYDSMNKEANSSVPNVPPPKPFKMLRGPGEEPEKGMSWHSTQMNGGYPKRESKAGIPDQWIPAWGSPFWRDYVNRLRVFQAGEGFYVLKDYGGDD